MRHGLGKRPPLFTSNQFKKKRMLPTINQKVLGIILFVVLLGAACVGYSLRKVGDNRGYSPEQPIPFSHKIHAGDNKIPCLYCHSNADNSKHSTVPGMNTCMNCHKVVKTDSPLIKQVTESYNTGKPLEWIKVHHLPEHANFNHKRHVKMGIDCASCHGDVASMDKIKQVKILNMGFCLDCHKNPQKMLPGVPGLPAKAPMECSTCHK